MSAELTFTRNWVHEDQIAKFLFRQTRNKTNARMRKKYSLMDAIWFLRKKKMSVHILKASQKTGKMKCLEESP